MGEIGIIGSGNIGSAVALRASGVGYGVIMANARGPASLGERAAACGAVPGTVEQAAVARDFVLIAIPEGAVADLPAGLFERTPAGAAVLDAGNYYPVLRDAPIAEIDAGMPDSMWVASRIGRPVLKMFNTIHAPTIVNGGRPRGAPRRICLPIAGDDAEAVHRAIAFADALGFDGLDAGPLAESWRQQPGTPAYCRDLDLPTMRDALAEAQHALITAYRRQAMDKARRMAAAAAVPRLSL